MLLSLVQLITIALRCFRLFKYVDFSEEIKVLDKKAKLALVKDLQQEMELAADNWEFEKAIELRDKLNILNSKKK